MSNLPQQPSKTASNRLAQFGNVYAERIIHMISHAGVREATYCLEQCQTVRSINDLNLSFSQNACLGMTSFL